MSDVDVAYVTALVHVQGRQRIWSGEKRYVRRVGSLHFSSNEPRFVICDAEERMGKGANVYARCLMCANRRQEFNIAWFCRSAYHSLEFQRHEPIDRSPSNSETSWRWTITWRRDAAKSSGRSRSRDALWMPLRAKNWKWRLPPRYLASLTELSTADIATVMVALNIRIGNGKTVLTIDRPLSADRFAFHGPRLIRELLHLIYCSFFFIFCELSTADAGIEIQSYYGSILLFFKLYKPVEGHTLLFTL